MLRYFSVTENHRANLGNHIPAVVQTGGFNVKADDFLCKVLLLVTMNHHPVVHVVDVVGLHTVKYLNVLGGMPRVREGLGNTVVSNGNGPMAPALRPLDHVLVRPRLGGNLGQGVHGGHSGV